MIFRVTEAWRAENRVALCNHRSRNVSLTCPGGVPASTRAPSPRAPPPELSSAPRRSSSAPARVFFFSSAARACFSAEAHTKAGSGGWATSYISFHFLGETSDERLRCTLTEHACARFNASPGLLAPRVLPKTANAASVSSRCSEPTALSLNTDRRFFPTPANTRSPNTPKKNRRRLREVSTCPSIRATRAGRPSRIDGQVGHSRVCDGLMARRLERRVRAR